MPRRRKCADEARPCRQPRQQEAQEVNDAFDHVQRLRENSALEYEAGSSSLHHDQRDD